MALQTPQQIRETIANRQAEYEAIVAIAGEENRDLTPEETTIVNVWHGEGDEAGDFGKLESDLAQAVKIEARKKLIIAGNFGSVTDDGNELGDVGEQTKAITVPAVAMCHGELKAYKGANASRDAYVAGHVYAASLLGSQSSKEWLERHGIQSALSEGDNTKGGIFVPVETETAAIRLVEEYGTFRQFASQESMAGDRKVIPVRTSGLTAYPVAETNTANQASNTGTESTPTWRNIELVARKWKVKTRMSDELNEDSLISMADQLTLEMALAFAIAEDGAGFLGDGTSTYHGIKGLANALLAGSIHTALAANLSFATLDLADFETLAGKLPDYPGIMPAWHITKEGYFASMARLMNAAGGNTSNNLAEGTRPMFLGYPVVFNQVTNKTLTTQASTRLLYLGDLGMAAKLGSRRGVTVSLSDQAHWEEDQIGIKATERFDINIHSTGTTSAAGAIMALETPAS